MGYYPGDETLQPFLVAPYGVNTPTKQEHTW